MVIQKPDVDVNSEKCMPPFLTHLHICEVVTYTILLMEVTRWLKSIKK